MVYLGNACFDQGAAIMTQTLVVDLPDEIYRYLQEIAGVTRQPLETLVRQSITGNLPPKVTTAPLDVQPDLLQMQSASVAHLRQIAESQVAPAQAARHLELLEKQQQQQLTPAERSELAELRTQADRLMVRKAYAWALLRWHGAPLPKLEETTIN
jgi:hypothetical protein